MELESKQKHSTQIISMFVGALLFVIGLAGILFPAFAGLHLSSPYSTIMATSGAILLYNGYKNNSRDAFMTCLFFTIFFGLHAVAGWVFGTPGIPTLGYIQQDPVLISIIPGLHELGRNDHILNTVLALVLLGGTIDWFRRNSQKGHRKETIRDLKQDYKNRYRSNKPIHD